MELKKKLGNNVTISEKSGLIKGISTLAKPLSTQDIEAAAIQYENVGCKIESFDDSTNYDVIIKKKRYPPKAIFGLALSNYYGFKVLSKHFKGGVESECFRALLNLGFNIESKQKKEINLKREDEFFNYSRFKIGQSFSKLESFSFGEVLVPGQGRDISGVARFQNCVVLFVTLDKGGKENEHKYRDRFTLGGKMFQWESQNNNTPQTPHMQMIINGSPVVLFARVKEKLRGKSQPFTFVGELYYVNYSYPLDRKDKPVEVIFKVLNYQSPAPEVLRSLYEWDHGHSSADSLISDVDSMTLVKRDAPTHLNEGQKLKSRSAHKTKIDWAERDDKNRNLGLAGEKLILQHEVQTLTAQGRWDLAELVKHEAVTNDCAGYDIVSFDVYGAKKFIEVKTTKLSKRTPFFISQNECNVSLEKGDQYWIYRVYNLDEANKTAEFYAINGPVNQNFKLKPENFKAYPR
ncbi:conserved hypothetical protein [Alteromonas sp. 38]|uniref:DUF3427 domain-containing protein n=1 Tax=unclassified Alteromonas TaxID=2614992 RepID=UPI0012F122EE|nr:MULTISPECIES: DUF3427 domain-containing protein [unclassified Alteromonas]CAD5273073.1 conserved hypothetical protein [Alteromonas sp. 154]VXB54982.1 conserved hypothetical protein [Alteromonas sp. 38]